MSEHVRGPRPDLAAGVPVGVVAVPGSADGRTGVRVRLEPSREAGVAGVDYVDQPTFLLLPDRLDTGTVAVDIRGSIRHGVSEMSRGFAGLAFHITDDFTRFECVYLRPANGARENPPSPRDQRAIQYFSYPNWPFDRLRDEKAGEYERPADVGLDTWTRLTVRISSEKVTPLVDGAEVLQVPRLDPATGSGVGLFVDIGTDALFANVTVDARRERSSSASPGQRAPGQAGTPTTDGGSR